MRDEEDENSLRFVIDAVDNAPIAYTITQQAGKPTSQALDAVMAARLAFKLSETTGQFSRQRGVRVGVKSPRLGRKDDLKHPNEPCAS